MGGALLSTFKYEIFPKIGLLHFLSFYAFQEMWICYLTFMPTGSGWNRKKSAAATVQNYTVPSKAMKVKIRETTFVSTDSASTIMTSS